jgi:hypothetical protein
MHLRWGTCTAFIAALPMMLVPIGALADEKSECIQAYEQAQELRLQHRLTAARGRLLVCSRAECPKAAVDDCMRWLGEVDASMPRVTVTVSEGPGGRVVTQPVVLIDGEPVTGWIDGHEIPLDPGPHTVRVEASGKVPAEQAIELHERDEPQLSFVLQDQPSIPGPTPSVPTRSRITAPFLVSGGVSVAGLASFTAFGLMGRSDAQSLASTCYPHCDDASIAHANRELLVADVSLGVAVVAAGLAAWFFFHAPARFPVASADGLRWSF